MRGRARVHRKGHHWQWLPLDPPDDGRATIGGVVASGLGGAEHTIIPDRIEAGTFLLAGAITGGDVTIDSVVGNKIFLTGYVALVTALSAEWFVRRKRGLP